MLLKLAWPEIVGRNPTIFETPSFRKYVMCLDRLIFNYMLSNSVAGLEIVSLPEQRKYTLISSTIIISEGKDPISLEIASWIVLGSSDVSPIIQGKHIR